MVFCHHLSTLMSFEILHIQVKCIQADRIHAMKVNGDILLLVNLEMEDPVKCTALLNTITSTIYADYAYRKCVHTGAYYTAIIVRVIC